MYTPSQTGSGDTKQLWIQNTRLIWGKCLDNRFKKRNEEGYYTNIKLANMKQFDHFRIPIVELDKINGKIGV